MNDNIVYIIFLRTSTIIIYIYIHCSWKKILLNKLVFFIISSLSSLNEISLTFQFFPSITNTEEDKFLTIKAVW